jgi:hypothetical protein
MAQMTLNAEIMAFGYSGMLASHKPEAEPSKPGPADDRAVDDGRGGAQFSVRSLLVRLRNPRA